MDGIAFPKIRRAQDISGIYCIRNSSNGKVYVGSAQRVHVRISLHRSTLIAQTHSNAHLQHAFNKYGEPLFHVSLLEEVPIDGLLSREQFWMDNLQAANPEYGYNIEPIAGRAAMAEETRKKISEAAKARWQTDTVLKEKLAQLIERNRSPEGRRAISERMTGRIWSEEDKLKMSEKMKTNQKVLDTCKRNGAAKKGKKRPEAEVTKIRMNAHGRKPVAQYDLNGIKLNEFTSLKHIKRSLGYDPSHISTCCKGQIGVAYGYSWKYVKP